MSNFWIRIISTLIFMVGMCILIASDFFPGRSRETWRVVGIVIAIGSQFAQLILPRRQGKER